ncbi:hypothetical protein G2W53_024434 [Senna tora]|uniref:Uncharacterized protein n=1 Tax=Senna tora TaxID=362788 RepID=A0A834TCS7_9FABA|nr:hypothetical protein G2W53_024434 [Senna tora]
MTPRLACTTCKANEVPGHPLLPLPNGIRWKCCPLTSTLCLFPPPSSLLMNLSGLNSSGFSQWFGSLPMAHTFTNNCVLAGISCPLTLQLSDDSLTISGPVG